MLNIYKRNKEETCNRLYEINNKLKKKNIVVLETTLKHKNYVAITGHTNKKIEKKVFINKGSLFLGAFWVIE